MRLSKSRFVAGSQCEKLLWLRVHDWDAPELRPDAALQAVFDRGHQVGERARQQVPSGVLIDFDPRRRYQGLRATRRALDAGATAVYEACFEQDGCFAAVDILERTASGRFVLIEVKSTLSVKPVHLTDLAVQLHVVRRAGLDVERVEVMHLNPDHRHPDVGELFIRADVTAEVEARADSVPDELRRQLCVIDGSEPSVEPGPHCHEPYDCPFISRCQPARPAHDVGELYGTWARTQELRDAGAETIDQLPDSIELPTIAARQRTAVKTGRPVVEPGLGAALDALPRPLAFLDFETIAPALPVWPGTRPYQALPVQHSVHRLAPDGSLEHDAFLMDGPDDGRAALADHLLRSTAHAATVLAWHAPFERDRIRELADALPTHRYALMGLHDRVVDFLPIVRAYYYHPDFHGSFSLKSVGPALAPELSYADLQVANGATASTLLEAWVLDRTSIPTADQEQLRQQLLAYCERDTLILARMLEVLRAQARVAAATPLPQPERNAAP